MKGKVNWIHVLDIFLIGLLGMAIFQVFIFPRNIKNAKEYPELKKEYNESKTKISSIYGVSEKSFDEWYREVNRNPEKWYVNNKEWQYKLDAMFINDMESAYKSVVELTHEYIDINDWNVQCLIKNSDIMDTDEMKFHALIKADYDTSKTCLNAIMIALLMPMCVTFIFCGVKIYEDIKG